MGGGFACGGGAIVAAKTGACDARVIEIDAGPAGCLVAVLTYIRGRNMGGRLAGCGGAIMATET